MRFLVGGFVALFIAAAAATPVTTGEDVIAQLAESVRDLVTSETEIKDRLLQATDALVKSQATIQNIFGGSSSDASSTKDKDVTDTKGEEEGVLKILADEIMMALRQFRSKSNATGVPIGRGTPVLQQILDEIKDLNLHIQTHLSSSRCVSPFIMIGGECFHVILEDMTWASARNNCLQMGADLAQPTDITALKNYVGQRYPRKGRRNFWIGGIYSEKVWQWLSGDLIDDTNWHINEPSGNGACLAMFDGWDNPFSDFPCDNERRSICKRI